MLPKSTILICINPVTADCVAAACFVLTLHDVCMVNIGSVIGYQHKYRNFLGGGVGKWGTIKCGIRSNGISSFLL